MTTMGRKQSFDGALSNHSTTHTQTVYGEVASLFEDAVTDALTQTGVPRVDRQT